jgi:hypothetical protein
MMEAVHTFGTRLHDTTHQKADIFKKEPAGWFYINLKNGTLDIGFHHDYDSAHSALSMQEFLAIV